MKNFYLLIFIFLIEKVYLEFEKIDLPYQGGYYYIPLNFPYKEKINDVSIVFNVDDSTAESAIEKYNDIEFENKKLVMISNEKLEMNDNASVFSDISEFLANIGTQYFIIADDSLENDFIKKAILHFKYLNKNYGILSGKNKFKIEIVNNYTNVLFDRKINDLNRESFDIYYI